MGKDARVTATWPDGVRDEGRLQFEPPQLLFRGERRGLFQGRTLEGVRAEAGDLVTADGTRFALGAKAASTWAQAILNPKGRLEKLGIKPGQKVGILGLADPVFLTELAAQVKVTNADSGLDILFYAADSAEALAEIPRLMPRLKERGALWVVSLKGKAAKLKDVDVIAAGRAAGLVDTKVCAFSDARTALRFVRRVQAAAVRPPLSLTTPRKGPPRPR